MKHKNYISTGELARVMDITKHTLFHYDEIGLFKPEYVDENGYRMYSMDQMEMLDTILILRDLQLPLKEIKKFIENRNQEAALECFAERQKQIDEEIKKLKALNHWLDLKKKSIEENKEIDDTAILIKKYPERYYLSMTVDEENSNFYKVTNEMISDFIRQEKHAFYQVAYIQYTKDILKENDDLYTNVSLLLLDRPQKHSYKVLPQGNYLVAYHKGHWNTIGKTLKKMLEFQKSHHLVCDDFYIEHYIVDNFLVENIEDYITEIAIRIIE